MRNATRRILRTVALAATVFAPSAVLAQVDGAGELQTEKPYVPWLIGIVILAVTIVVAFMNPKRSHDN